MGFVGDLLGLGGKKGSPGQVVDVAPDEFVGLRQPVADTLRGLLTGQAPTLAGIPAASGPRVASLMQPEQDILARIRSTLTGPGGTGTAANNLLRQTLRGEFLSPQANPFLQATIEAAQRPIRRQFEEVVLPNLRSVFTAGGQVIQGEGSSPFARAQALAAGDFVNALSDVSTRIAAENFQAERGRQQQAITQATRLSQSELENLVQGLRAVALPRLIEQMGIDRGTEDFNRRVDTLLRAIALAQGASTAQPVVMQPTPGTSGQNVGSLLEGVARLVEVNPFGVFGP